MSAILFVVGASGCGKTTAVHALETRGARATSFHYFDSIGVPSDEEMTARFGGGEAWQQHATRVWVERLRTQTTADIAVLDGQVRPSFVRTALDGKLVPSQIMLLDCSSEVRLDRLIQRGQPELANARMDSWAAHLRGQADALGLPVVDTSRLRVAEVADAIAEEIEQLRSRDG